MLANARDPVQRIWFQTLVWLPFNAIATAVYYAIMQRLRAHLPAARIWKTPSANACVAVPTWSRAVDSPK
jgi:hypothetical protein